MVNEESLENNNNFESKIGEKKKLKKRIIIEIFIGAFLILAVWTYKHLSFTNDKLISAIQNNDVKEVTLILKTKKISHVNLNEALLEAIYNDNLIIVKILVESGADINYCGKDSYSNPLLRAAYYGYADITKYLLDKGADTHITLPKNPYTPLAISVMKGNIATTKLLVEKENSIDYKDNYGITALIYALDTQDFNKELCEFLVSKGANIETRDDSSDSTLLIRVTSSDKNSEIKVKFLLDHGANINATDSVKMTPFLTAVQCGNLNLVKLYIEKGANIFARNTWNQSALDLAKQHNHGEIYGFLKKHGLN